MEKAFKQISMYLSLLLVATVLIVSSCSTQEDDLFLSAVELESPYGDWIFEGYAIESNKTINKVSPNNSIKPITLQLSRIDSETGKYTGNTESNIFEGEFTITSKKKKISFPREHFITSKIHETDNGQLFLKNLFAVTKYRVDPNKLLLYYSNDNIMLFSKAAEKK